MTMHQFGQATFSALLLTSAPIALAPAALAQEAGTTVPEAADYDQDTGVIVVTARRREETLQDVPIAVSAFSGETLAQQGAVDITALQQQTPNLTLQIARGSNSTLIAFLRGVGQQDPLWGFEPGVGLYVDDVYVARPQGAVLDIFDVDRIEVLRGPQGTLYGRNTIGGAIKYVTKRLGHDFSGKARAVYGSYNQIDLVGQVTIPVGDKISIGGAVAYYNRDGYGENLNTGNDQYDKDVIAGRVSIEFEPSDGVFFRIAADKTVDNSNARHGTRLIGLAGLPDFEPTASVYDTRAGIGDDNKVKTQGISLTGEIELNDTMTLKTISAYRDGHTTTLIDFDNTPQPILDIPAFYDDRQYTQELQLLYQGDRLQGVFGLYYLDGRASGAFDTVLGLANLTILTSGTVKTRSYAAFGDFSYDLTDQFAISVGGRYTSDKKKGSVYRQNFTGIRSPAFGNGTAIPGLLRTDYTNSKTFDEFTPRVSLTYKPDRDLTLYASYSKGFKSGGFDMRGDVVLTPDTVNGYKPETVDAYEVGLKGAFLDRSLFVNLAGYYSDYKDQQVTLQIPIGASIASFVDNAGKSRIYGFELETRMVPSRHFSVTAAIGYTNAKFKEYLAYDLATGTRVDVADQRKMQNTPSWNGNVSATWSVDVAGGSLALTPAVSFRSDYHLFEIPTPLLDQDGYALLDASVTWTSEDDRYKLGVHGRNLTNERYRVGGYNFPGALFGDSIIGYYGPPRTIAVSAEVRF
ncbi:MAG: TonB-dependent receptor [Sphingobium sp.]